MTANKKILTANEMRIFDDWAINSIGIPGIILMENAGRAVADEVYNSYFAKKSGYSQVDVFCGMGNNGGDGLVAARHLLIRDIKVKVYVVGGISGLSADSELNFRILRKIGAVVTPILTEKDLSRVKLGKKDVIVDALFGIGLNRDIYGIHKDTIEFMNSAKFPIISVDVPSGLNANTGEDWGACIHAKKTVTFSFPKRGFQVKSGKEAVGKVIIADIGSFKKKITR
ncbi:MAG: NAD(P)H-hydrate epimerase [Elusimicrobiota bacterium]